MRVPIGDVQPGMVVAEEIKDAIGRVLVGKGTEVTDRHIRILQMCGIELLAIEGGAPDGEALSPEEEARLGATVEALRPRFALAGTGHPALGVLLDALARRAVRAGRRREGAAHA